jgi:CRISPR-associated DxTHG motif protein
MTVLLTFLGTGRYETVTYVWYGDEGERSCTTNLFPEAAHAVFAPERVLVCVTPQVRAHDNFRALKERLGEKLRPLDIPEGKTQAELWEIFDRIVAAVGEGEEVILDVTHAFRSLPLVVFTVATYLRRTKGVTIRHIVYGAYDARDPYRTPPEPTDRALVFDLTLMLELLDWLSGSEALLDRSDAVLLAEKMERAHNALWRERAAGELPRRLKSVAQKLRELSHALHLSRPRDVMRLASELVPLLDDARAELGRWAKPFAVIAERVRAELEPLAGTEPMCSAARTFTDN